MGILDGMAHRWFTHLVLIVMVVFVALTLINAMVNGGQGAWLAVASIASVLAVMVAVGPGRFQ